ncbi:hypothetical protein CCICO_10370 [Corynebacterium ciconiae DSM 44920]|uniref:hypothetical protein n=1 Tax=Corynebacterium ciconiae TaxID=227319 RepID=UPI0003817920|nr:hypothetical protein [Corynebacterium ciconiae]WKD62073.1 hypothetical protein CCICO_10370 [Corynebacterium ciconiae DSM 44920]
MSDQQLTVAELLARASKESGDDAPRRRRRRRSLEEGGVSVAELTGSIPKVDESPEQPKHTSQPIDAENTARAGADAPAADAPAEEDGAAASTAQGSNEAATAESEPQQDQAPAFNPKLNRVPRGSAKQDKDETMVLDVVHENEQPRLTTDTFQAVSPEQAKAHAEQNQPAPAQPEQVESIERSPESEGEARDEAPTAHFDAVGEQPRSETPQRRAPYMAAPAQSDQSQAQPNELAEPEADAPAVDEDSERSVSIPAIIGMTVVAVVIGIAIFKGFELLWSNFNNIITGVLAVAVTGGIVGIVHAMRTDRDKLTMVLAAVVGLVLTFGPSLIAGL